MPNPKNFKGEGAKERFIEKCMKQRAEEGGELTEQDKAICINQSRRMPGKQIYPKRKKAIAEILRDIVRA
jgi:hypothetical protein